MSVVPKIGALTHTGKQYHKTTRAKLPDMTRPAIPINLARVGITRVKELIRMWVFIIPTGDADRSEGDKGKLQNFSGILSSGAESGVFDGEVW